MEHSWWTVGQVCRTESAGGCKAVAETLTRGYWAIAGLPGRKDRVAGCDGRLPEHLVRQRHRVCGPLIVYHHIVQVAAPPLTAACSSGPTRCNTMRCSHGRLLTHVVVFSMLCSVAAHRRYS